MEQKQIFGVILGVIVCIVMLFAGLYLTGQIGMKKNVVPAAAEVQTTETTDTTMTAAETTAETTTVTTTTAQSAESLSAAEKERLHTIYGEKMTVVGDSIAYGFNAYGYISDEQNLAQGSVGIRNIHEFTFTDNDGQEVDVLDALEERQPAYIYMSMGMNDVNMCTEEEYINYYQEAISSIQQLCPNSNIIVAGITPVASDSDYTDNAEIRKFNDGLEQMIADLQQPNVVYFDAYSIVADPDTQDMNPGMAFTLPLPFIRNCWMRCIPSWIRCQYRIPFGNCYSNLIFPLQRRKPRKKPILILEQIPETGQILKHTNNANQSFCSSGCRKTDFLFFPAKTLEKKRTLCYNNNNVM